MPANKSQVRFLFTLLAIVWGFLVGANSLLAAWSPPTAVPPGNNPDPFLSTNSNSQSKAGPLTINNDFYVIGSGITGRVGLGTTTATSARLVIAPIADVALNNASIDAGDGYVSTSRPAMAGTDLVNLNYLNSTLSASLDTIKYWTLSGSNLYASSTTYNVAIGTTTAGTAKLAVIGGNVGIGTNNPLARLNVFGTTKLGMSPNATTHTLDIGGNINFDYLDDPSNAQLNGIVLTPSAGGNLEAGTYHYNIVFVTADGETGSNQSASVPSVVTALNDKVTITNIPTITNARVTGRKIYRSIVNGGRYHTYYLTTINDNTTTSYVDTLADSSLGSESLYRKSNTTAGQIFAGESKILQVSPFISAFGFGALQNNTSGNSSTAIGPSALRNNTTGANNNATGHSSLVFNTTGSGNNGYGYATLYANRTGLNNSAFGDGALRSDTLTTGYNYNSAFGSGALSGLLDNSNYNVAVGRLAGAKTWLAASTANTFIGARSSQMTLSSGNYNILIGYNADTPSATISRFLNLGQVIYATGLGSGGADPSGSGAVGIGTTNPSSRLFVRGSGSASTTSALNIQNSSGVSALFVRDDGYVGIGTTSPAVALYVNGNVIADTPTAANHLATKSYVDTVAQAQSLWVNSGNYLYASSTSWRVGIGTTSPGAALHIYPRSDIEGLRIISSNFAPLVIRDATDQNDLFRVNQYGDATAVTSSATRMRSNNYCDASGANCFDPSSGWSTEITTIFLTSTTINGNFVFTGGFVGYDAGNKICNSQQAGSHFCRTDEIMYLIQKNGASSFSSINGQDAWIADGPPGFTGAVAADDCSGWTNGTTSYLGHFWIFNSSGGGKGALINCATTKKIACCK